MISDIVGLLGHISLCFKKDLAVKTNNGYLSLAVYNKCLHEWYASFVSGIGVLLPAILSVFILKEKISDI